MVYDLFNHGFLARFTISFLSSFYSNKAELEYSRHISANISLLGISCPADPYCSLKDLQLDETVENVSLLVAYIVPSNTRRGSHREGDFQGCTSLTSPSPVTKGMMTSAKESHCSIMAGNHE